MLKKIGAFSIVLNLLLILAFFYLIYSLGGPSYVWFKAKNRGVTGVYAHRAELFEELKIKSGSLVFLGNSITEQCEWAELLQLPTVVNRGIAMDHTLALLDRLDPITSAKPKAIFLMIGVNDLITTRPQQVSANYRKILARIKEQTPSTQVYIQSVLPVNNRIRETGIENEDILTLNRHIRSLGHEFVYPYIDLHTLLKDRKGRLDEGYTEDGIHLNAKAYRKWGAELRRLELIPEVLEE